MAESKDQPKPKRRVRDPETFRERAIKATVNADKPARRHRIRGFFRTVVAFIFKPIGRLIKFIFYRQPFLLLRRPMRILGKVLLVTYIARYLYNSWGELRQVTWPSWRTSRQLTFAVILFATIFGAGIAGVDWGLDKLFKHILLK